MHRLVGHLATSNSDSVAKASNQAVSDTDSVAEASRDETMSSNEATMSPNKGTRSRDEAMSSNETSVSSNETKVGNRGCSGGSHESDNRCKGLETMLENLVRVRGVCVLTFILL